MNLKDINHYVHRLLTESNLGWSDQPKLLANFMGFTHAWMLRNRVYVRKRMTLAEQKRASAALERILKGEIRCEQRLFQGKVVGDVVEVEHPVPLFYIPGYRCTIDLGKKGVKLAILRVQEAQKRRILPTFRSLRWPS